MKKIFITLVFLFSNLIFAQNFEYGSIKVDVSYNTNVKNQLKEFKQKGTISIIENSFLFDSKFASANYEIISKEDNFYKIKNKEMIHEVRIKKESGKVKGYKYTYIIEFTTSKEMDSSISYYYCNLKE
jgi:hypothetical protein